MEMKEKLDIQNPSDRKKIINLLEIGKIGIFPTDTVFGICCRMDSNSSIKKIYEIKNREENKPFLVLASNISQIEEYAYLNEKAKILAGKYWPGPLTIILESKIEKVDPILRANRSTVGVRIPKFAELTEVIENLGIPIVAPSANISGRQAPIEFNQIDKEIVEKVDFIVTGECKIKKPSTIIDSTNENLMVIREGAIDINL